MINIIENIINWILFEKELRIISCLGTHLIGFSFFLSHRAYNETPATFTILNLTPGKSPTAWPDLPKPATSTSSFSSMKLIPPSLGTKAVILLLFFLSWTLTHFLTAEFGCLASTATFSTTIPAACEDPANGFLHFEFEWDLLYPLSAHLIRN